MTNHTDSYQKRATSPLLWHTKAANLALSAAKLWENPIYTDCTLPDSPHSGYHSVSLMLMGLSIESLLKGIILHEEPSLAVERLDSSLSKHGLIYLCNKAEVLVEETYEEKTLLNRLTDAVLWSSKYPIPRHHQHLASGPNSGQKVWVKNSYDLQNFERFWNKLNKIYQIRTGYPKV